MPCDLVAPLDPPRDLQSHTVRVRCAEKLTALGIDVDAACVFAGGGALFFLTKAVLVQLVPSVKDGEVDVAFSCPSPLGYAFAQRSRGRG